jgi:hypothetical protein
MELFNKFKAFIKMPKLHHFGGTDTGTQQNYLFDADSLY